MARRRKAAAALQPSPDVLEELAVALGYDATAVEEPYLKYIVSQAPHGRGSLDSYLRLFISVVQFFVDKDPFAKDKANKAVYSQFTIESYIKKLVADAKQEFFADTPSSNDIRDVQIRQIAVADTVLLIIGTWTLMHNYFSPQRGDSRRILAAFCVNTGKQFDEDLALGCPLSGLLQGSGLLPGPHESGYTNGPGQKGSGVNIDTRFGLHPAVGAVESLEISPSTLNAFKLANLGAVRILWTNNLSRHMLLSRNAKQYYLELFAIPSALSSPGPGRMLSQVGISGDLQDEIYLSYAPLFNPRIPSWSHRYIGALICLRHWCWCLSCSSRRLASRQLRVLRSHAEKSDSSLPRYDPLLKNLMQEEPKIWDQIEFGYLWPRIVALDAHLAGSKPWSFWVIFRDRRDSVQFWTFLFGTVILILTFLQVFLGIAQVVSGFK
ncbi:hypothetical protein BCR34DRAFT_572745 [Clohesyomyces aquaticus]|uniref:Uncharacterized protein n=1 Tax=Clohesyomyces aquaticus TaxID=1231657 RepID=A0A1Y1Z259_9PLEO|nr:hypothetical protein BCR34DRAFT_572745 [Clohesyomyces aquaticus]